MRIGLDISVLSEKKRTGIGVYVYELITHLLRLHKADQFVLFGIATLQTHDYLKSLFKDFENVEIKVYKLPAKLFRLVFIAWQKINWPPIEYFIGKVDIFHSFNWYMPPQKYGKSVATVFDVSSILYPEWHDRRTTQLDKIRFERMNQMADLVLAISNSSSNDFRRIFTKKKTEVVYPAATGDFVRLISKKLANTVLRKFKLRPGFILSVSTLEPRKNLEGLIEAYLKSEQREPLVLVGKLGWKSESLDKKIRENFSRIIKIGFVTQDELKVLYQQAGCFVYPSFYEGFGIPVLEALSSGTPVICSKNSSLPEVGGGAVIYIDPYNIDTLVQAIKNLNNKKLKLKMIRKGLKQAEKFSWNKSSRKLSFLYSQVVKAKG